MKLFGQKLETEMIPAAGPWMAVFLIAMVIGLAVLLFGTGNNELDRYLVAGGMFSMGVLFAQKLPVWRAVTSLEHARMDAAQRVDTPLTPWINFAKQVGWPGAILFFLLICAAFWWLATS